jgi:hypothetical protein
MLVTESQQRQVQRCDALRVRGPDVFGQVLDLVQIERTKFPNYCEAMLNNSLYRRRGVV